MARRWKKQDGPCKVDDCDTAAVTREWCEKHYRRWQRTGSPDTVRPPGFARTSPATCTIDGCDQAHAARGWCMKHYTRWKNHGAPDAGRKRRVYGDDAQCEAEGCTTRPYKSGLCSRHHQASQYRLGGGRVPRAKVEARWAMWGGKCYMCGAPANCTDHVKPRAKGGLNLPANLRPACTACNVRKSDSWAGVR